MLYNYLICMAQVISLDMMSLSQLPFAIMLRTAGLAPQPGGKPPPCCAKLPETDRKSHSIVFRSCFTTL